MLAHCLLPACGGVAFIWLYNVPWRGFSCAVYTTLAENPKNAFERGWGMTDWTKENTHIKAMIWVFAARCESKPMREALGMPSESTHHHNKKEAKNEHQVHSADGPPCCYRFDTDRFSFWPKLNRKVLALFQQGFFIFHFGVGIVKSRHFYLRGQAGDGGRGLLAGRG